MSEVFGAIGHHKKRAFLTAYVECATIMGAAEAAQISRQTHYDWVEGDKEYADAFNLADMMAGDVLVAAAVRRAVEGLRVYKFDKDGGPIKHPETGEPYYEVKYSDVLLMFLIKANNPTKFGDKVEQTHKGDAEAPVRIYMPHNGRDSEATEE